MDRRIVGASRWVARLPNHRKCVAIEGVRAGEAMPRPNDALCKTFPADLTGGPRGVDGSVRGRDGLPALVMRLSLRYNPCGSH